MKMKKKEYLVPLIALFLLMDFGLRRLYNISFSANKLWKAKEAVKMILYSLRFSGFRLLNCVKWNIFRIYIYVNGSDFLVIFVIVAM